MYTHQEIFDKIATHLFNQGEQSTNENGSCLYRGPEGRKCSAGFLITDDEYSSMFEGHSIGDLQHDRIKGFLNINAENIDLIEELQNAHDVEVNWKTTKTMRKRLREVAKEFKLLGDCLKTLKFEDR